MKYRDNILNFNEWLKSHQEEDGRQWELREGPDGSCQYVELIPDRNPYDTDGDTALTRAGRKARSVLYQRVQKPEKTYVTRISYTRAVRQYHPGGDVPLYSGSSLQRKKHTSPTWMRRMNRFFWRHKPDPLPRVLIPWATAGGQWIRERVRSFHPWRLTSDFWGGLTVKPNTRIRERWEPGIRVQARQKIYAALSAMEFAFLPDYVKPETLHYFSGRSKNKFQEAARAFWRAYPGPKSLVTLTFIQHVTDQQGVGILNKFLTIARREFPGLQYMWVAEHQPENPERTIHFHIIFNRWLRVKRFNPLWVLEQYNAGLRGQSRRLGRVIELEEFVAYYNARKVGRLFNPFHIDPGKNISQLAAYLTKYVTKTAPDEAFGCGNWHSSRKVSRLFKKKTEQLSTFNYLHSFKNNIVNYKTKEQLPPMTFKHPFFSMVRVHNAKLVLPIFEDMEKINRMLLTTDWRPGEWVGGLQIGEEEFKKKFPNAYWHNGQPYYVDEDGILWEH